MRQITNGSTPALMFTLLDEVTKKPKANIAPETISIFLSKNAGPLSAIAAPSLTVRDKAVYFWTPKPGDTSTDNAFVWKATAPGCDDWLSEELVVTAPPPVAVGEAGVTEAQIMAAVRHDKATEIGRITGQTSQLVEVASGEGVAE